MQRLVDNVLAVTKESVKIFTYEALNNFVRLVNGMSALLLAVLPGKSLILEGIHEWELRPTFRGPRLPRWMEDGASSFNKFIHELSVDSDTSSNEDYMSDEDSDGIIPASPLSHSSRFSRASSFSKPNRHSSGWIKCLILWILFPLRILLIIPSYLYNITHSSSSTVQAKPENRYPPSPHSRKKSSTMKDHFVQSATDRRRGVVEDLHLGIEIAIEAIFDIVHKVAYCVFSPLESFKKLLHWFSSRSKGSKAMESDTVDATVMTATLGQNDAAVTERKTTLHNSLNTDARTCQDVITELGYPYEAIRVVTADGYILLLERIPRRDSRKAIYLQHGVLDSSMGWVSKGVVGSPVFAAFDQGYDVFLGNLRGLVSREHIDKNISSRQYWHYSINEHGTEDVPAMIEKIHEVKTAELKLIHPDQVVEDDTNTEKQPYKLCAICHSLGGAAMLMYVITRRIEEKPHRLARLILLSPAGFHHDSTVVFTVVQYLLLLITPIIAPIVPAFYIPTRFFRMLLNKLARDFHNYPALGGLVQTLVSYIVGGDSSNWIGVIGLPHYNMNDMPGVSFQVAHHLAQMKRAGRFIMFDYGSKSANMKAYGSPEPLDLGEYYGLIDFPVDLVAGRKDKVVRPSMVKFHHDLMKSAGVQEVTYNEFEYAHLDFTFSHREELLAYVMSRLNLVEPNQKSVQKQSSKTRKKDHTKEICSD
ncbi:uncharacterized protein LOC124941332 [Impatiens glandulifera]|uniref:uncharacterized protein LOC124941332 n=1 Tax=Impatiens glandulifera TaxID=253017 RepID=UPI001FB086B9|nr:uncharacterized protein LOC124941332 [Impatiens glandulifera]